MSEIWIKIPNRGEGEINCIIDNIKEALTEKGNYKLKKYSDKYPDCQGHDHCEICWQVIACEADEMEGYFGENHTVCMQCFKMFIESDNFYSVVNSLAKIEK